MLALLPYVRPIVLLVGSNVFMTAAWYWHLRYKEVHLCDLHQLGSRLYRILPGCTRQSLRQRRLRSGTIEDDPGGHHLCGVRRFSYVYLREPITLSQGVGFALIAAGAFFVFHKW